MHTKDFEALAECRYRKSARTLSQKMAVYATTDDRLSNFKVAGKRMFMIPEGVLLMFKQKHDTALFQAIRELNKNSEFPHMYSFVQYQEWIGDSMNYLILLEALLAERFGVNIESMCRIDESTVQASKSVSKPRRHARPKR